MSKTVIFITLIYLYLINQSDESYFRIYIGSFKSQKKQHNLLVNEKEYTSTC